MTLIFILIALGFDFFLGGMERFRNSDWFLTLFYWLEKRLAHIKFWDGSIGLILVLAIPVAGLFLLLLLLNHWSWALETVFTLAVLMYCLAPENLDDRLDQYITATEDNDNAKLDLLADELIDNAVCDKEDTTEASIIKSAFTEAHQRTFAVIFWFLVLGVVGALLYRLVTVLEKELGEIHSGFSDSTKVLLSILEWPSTRLTVIGLALAGSLVDGLEAWRESEALSFEVNHDVLAESGLGALQYMPDIDVPDRTESYWIEELKALLNRTLILWLAILAIMTLSGKLG